MRWRKNSSLSVCALDMKKVAMGDYPVAPFLHCRFVDRRSEGSGFDFLRCFFDGLAALADVCARAGYGVASRQTREAEQGDYRCNSEHDHSFMLNARKTARSMSGRQRIKRGKVPLECAALKLSELKCNKLLSVLHRSRIKSRTKRARLSMLRMQT